MTFSSTAEWAGLQMVNIYQPICCLAKNAANRHIIYINVGNTAVHTDNDPFRPAPVANMGIYPAHYPQTFCSHSGTESILMYLDPALITKVAGRLFPDCVCELLPQPDICFDALIFGIGLELKNAMATNAVNSDLYAQELINKLASHVVLKYCLRKNINALCLRRLHTQHLAQAIEYIYKNLEKPISVVELADLVKLSHFHFIRLFKQETGYTPHHFHIRCRIEKAKHLMQNSQLTLSEIAYEVGFTSQAQFNHLFKRYVGSTPSNFLRKKK